MKVVCRPAQGADLPGIYAVETACFQQPWTYESLYTDMCLNAHAYYCVAEEDGRTVGFCGMHTVLDEGHIMNVAVLPAYRNRGIGEALLRTMIADTGLAYYTLEVRVSNTAAISLYTRLGFDGAGLRPGYYGDEDALIMWRGKSVP